MLRGDRFSFTSSSNQKIQQDAVSVSAQSEKQNRPPLVQKSIDGILTHSYTSRAFIPKTQKTEEVIVSQTSKEQIVEISEVVVREDLNGSEGFNITEEHSIIESEVVEPGIDPKKRSFLKLASMAGLGAVAVSMIPKKAEAYVMGATPTSSVVGVKNASNTRVNPATEETLQTLLSGQSVLKKTVTLTNSGDALVPSSGKKIRVYSTRFSLTSDLGSVSFRFTSGGTDYEKYVGPKAGGLYGANNHPNFVEGGVNQAVYCVLSGSATVQINIDYLEV